MDITFTIARRAPANAAVVAHGLTTEGLKSPPDGLDPSALRRLGFTAEPGQVQVVPAGERLVAAVGLGAADGVDLRTLGKPAQRWPGRSGASGPSPPIWRRRRALAPRRPAGP